MLKEKLICPRCGQEGRMVKHVTIQSHLKPPLTISLTEVYGICNSPFCEVVYFGPNIYLKENLKVKVWYKETDQNVPVCYCRVISTADIFKHIVTNQCCETWDDIKAHIGVSQDQACQINNPAGV